MIVPTFVLLNFRLNSARHRDSLVQVICALARIAHNSAKIMLRTLADVDLGIMKVEVNVTV